MNNILSMISQFRQNPMQMLMQKYKIPQNINNPQEIIQHLLNSGQVTQDQVTFNGNIAIPSTGTPGPIAIALALDGEPIMTSRAIAQVAAVATEPPTTENFYNVTSTAIITVPKGCCFNISVENVSEGATPTTPAPAILVQNANLTVTRIA